MFQLIFGILLLLVIIFVYTGLGILTREIFADKKCDICLIINNIATIPTAQAAKVPMTIASSIDKRLIAALPSLLSNSTNASVKAAKPILVMLPKSGLLLLPPIDQRAATGIKVKPMVVMTAPVTSGGKNLIIIEKTGVIKSPRIDAAMTAPNTDGRPPPAVTIATIVATLAKDTPCTNGS